MDQNFEIDGSTKAGTAGGTLLILFVHLTTGEILKTILLAFIGAVVSFLVSLILKRVKDHIFRR